MAIQTQQAFSGFIASDPQLSETENGDARLYMKVGKEHYRQEQDGSFTQLETTFHHLVAFKAAAEQGAERIAKGDKIVAEGYVREYRYQDANGQNVESEEFIAGRIGHDLAPPATKWTARRVDHPVARPPHSTRQSLARSLSPRP